MKSNFQSEIDSCHSRISGKSIHWNVLPIQIRTTRGWWTTWTPKSDHNQSIDRSRSFWWWRCWDTLGACGKICWKEETKSVCAAEFSETKTISDLKPEQWHRSIFSKKKQLPTLAIFIIKLSVCLAVRRLWSSITEQHCENGCRWKFPH